MPIRQVSQWAQLWAPWSDHPSAWSNRRTHVNNRWVATLIRPAISAISSPNATLTSIPLILNKQSGTSKGEFHAIECTCG
jgi:hypothetical protein